MKITRLTPEQEARFGEFRDKWLAIGLSTEPADRPAAETAIVQAYRSAGLEPPRSIVWCGSPLSQGLTRAIILDKKTRASVWASVGASVRDSVWASVYGQHEAGWLSFYDYFRNAAGLTTQTDRLQGLSALAQSAGWAIPHQQVCWVSERHNILARDERGRLHSIAGPAVAYPDGWAIYAVHGVRVPEQVITAPQTLTIKQIEYETNAEVRRVMVERFGMERFILESGAQLVHTDECGALYRKELSQDEPLVAVHVVNSTPEPDGSVKKYILRVPPTIQTAREAVAWTFNLKPEQYKPQIET